MKIKGQDPKPAEMTEPYGGYSRCVYCAQPTLGGINCSCEGEQYHRDTVREHSKLSAAFWQHSVASGN